MTDSTSRTIYCDRSVPIGPPPVREVAVAPRSLKDSTSPDAVIISSGAKPSGTGTVRSVKPVLRSAFAVYRTGGS